MSIDNKVALLIDAENISSKYLEAVVREVTNNGRIVYSRFYGDIRKLSDDWNTKAINLAIKPQHQYNVATKKNAADMAMALDAMEIMYQEKVNVFFIVSSDSDFTPLATKLKEGGMYVYGIGDEQKVSDAFKSSCNEFKYFNYLIDNHDDNESDSTDTLDEKIDEKKTSINQEIIDIIIEKGTDNKLMLSRLGDILVNRYSDFDPRKYGVKSLTGLVSSIDNLEISKEDTTTYVSIEIPSKREIDKLIENIISRNKSKKMKLSKLMQEIQKEYPSFDYKNYGFSRFKKYLFSNNNIKVTKNDEAKLT